jgi:predicted P-loop ATPase
MSASNLSAIPEALSALPQWVTWRYESGKDGKRTKLPFVAGTDRRASSVDPDTWCSFDAAISRMNGDSGLGFVFTSTAGIIGIDLDGCIADGIVAGWAQRIVSRVGSYAERSPGSGIHILALGTLPAGARKRGSLELYDTGRYFTVTGNRLDESPAAIEQADVAWLHRLMTAGLFDFRKHTKLAALLKGDITGYASQSEADLAFCSLLARLGLDETGIADAVSISGLWREKWEERNDYRERTIGAALKSLPARQIPIADGQGDREWSKKLLRSEAGAPLRVLGNAVAALRFLPELRGLLAFDDFSQQIISCRETPWRSGPGEWSDVDDLNFAAWLGQYAVHVSSKVASEAVNIVAGETHVHPLQEFLNSCGTAWDNQPRVEHWLSTYLGCEETKYTRLVGKVFLIACVARAYEPGCKSDNVLLLEGEQGSLKSTALRTLAGDAWFSDTISAFGSKDSREELLGVWVCELAELDRIRGAALERTKSFLSTSCDRYRKSYGRRAGIYPRSTVFCGSTNDSSYLCDESGARRFWPIKVGAIKIDDLRRDRVQLWGEAVMAYRAGDAWWLSSEQETLARAEQKQRYEGGSRDDLIEAWIKDPQRCGDISFLDWFGSTEVRINITDVLLHGLRIPKAQIRPVADRKEVARCLRHLGYEEIQERAGEYRGKRFFVKGRETE